MTPKEFFDKVVEMRRCQKEYFKNKRQIDLSGNKKEEYREIKKYWIGRLAKCGGHNSYEKTGFYSMA